MPVNLVANLLPPPFGPSNVGSISQALVDYSRERSLVHDEVGRQLFIKMWYPALTPPATKKPERLWGQLRDEAGLPTLMRWFIRWVNQHSTHTVASLNIAPQSVPYRVVIYNHGLISFASENTSLVETLASLGYIVVSVQHRDQLQEFRTLENQLSAAERKHDKAQTKALRKKTGREQQQAAYDFYQTARNTNKIVHARALDSHFILKNLPQLLSTIPGMENANLEEPPRDITAIGLSLGGAVSMELAKLSHDITRVINIDGGIFGELQSTALTIPSLTIYSEQNKDISKFALSKSENNVTSETIAGSKHLNFHDIALILPRLLKAIGGLGRRSPLDVINDRNQVIKNFIR